MKTSRVNDPLSLEILNGSVVGICLGFDKFVCSLDQFPKYLPREEVVTNDVLCD